MTEYVAPPFGLIGLTPQRGTDSTRFYSFSGAVGHPATSVTLEFGDSGVASIYRLVRTEALHNDPDRVASELAFSAIHLLINTLGPALRPASDRDVTSAQHRTEELAANDAMWEDQIWSLEGQHLPAKICRYGNSWAGYAIVDAGRGVIVVGVNINVENVHLREIEDTSGLVPI